MTPIGRYISSPMTLLQNVRLVGCAGHFDLSIANGVVRNISAHSPSITAEATVSVIQGDGHLAIPAFVDGHMHLDKTFLGTDWISHVGADDVKTRIAEEKRLRRNHAASMAHRARTLAETALAFGTTAIRTHVDIDDETRLKGIEQILELREECSELLDVQVVAFPQSGLFSCATIVEDMKAAVEIGADVIGGLDPSLIDGDFDKSLAVTFGLADRFGKPIDIHLHEPGEIGASAVAKICERTVALGLQGKVVVSHAYCLADVPHDALSQLAEMMQFAGVAIMTGAPGAGKLIPVSALIDHGVRIFVASDNVRDAWAPFGNGDMLDRARLLAYRADFRDDAKLEFAFDCATDLPADILGFTSRGPRIGRQADIILLDTPMLAQAVCDVPTQRRIIRKGRLLPPGGGGIAQRSADTARHLDPR
jgi:cytosine/creatinine deaminase